MDIPFDLGNDGNYVIEKFKEGQRTMVGMHTRQQSSVIQPGGKINLIHVECIGDSLALVVNGQSLANVQDPDLIAGDVGLHAGTYDDSGTNMLFDNFGIYAP